MWQSWNCPERCTKLLSTVRSMPVQNLSPVASRFFHFSLKLWNPVVTPQKPFNTWPQNSWIPCLKLNGKSDMWISAGKQACRSEKIFHICGTLHVQLSFDLKHCSHLVESYLTSPQCLFWNLQWSSFHKEGPSHARPFKVKHFWIAIFAHNALSTCFSIKQCPTTGAKAWLSLSDASLACVVTCPCLKSRLQAWSGFQQPSARILQNTI